MRFLYLIESKSKIIRLNCEQFVNISFFATNKHLFLVL